MSDDAALTVTDDGWRFCTFCSCATNARHRRCCQKGEEQDRVRTPLTHVAIRFRGFTYALPKPNRHHDVLRCIVARTGARYVDAHDEDQGFLDEGWRYLTRKQASVNAEINGQIKNGKIIGGVLTSEDLW